MELPAINKIISTVNFGGYKNINSSILFSFLKYPSGLLKYKIVSLMQQSLLSFSIHKKKLVKHFISETVRRISCTL